MAIEWEGWGEVRNGIKVYARDIEGAIDEGFQVLSVEGTAYMKSNHKWRNRTGNAENRLVVEVEKGENTRRLVFVSGAHYGADLERRYPLVGPTAEQYTARVLAMLRAITR